MYWQHVSPEFARELDRLAELYAACRNAFYATANDFHWRPVDGSAAHRDAQSLPAPDPAITSPQGETGHRLVAEVLQTYLMLASHHLGGLAALHRGREVLFPPSMLVRAVVENCSHAIWVLGKDNDFSERRLARAYLEDMLSAEEAKKNAGRMQDKTSQEYVEAKEEYDGIKAEILQRFPGSNPQTLGTRTLHGETLPRLEDGVAQMYERFRDELGSAIGRDVALGMYGFLSNMTHPTIYPARQLRTWVSDPEHPGELVTNLELDIDFVQNQGSVAVVAFYNTLALVTLHFGWPGSIVNELTERIRAVLPDSLA